MSFGMLLRDISRCFIIIIINSSARLSPEVAVFNRRPDGNHDIDTQVSNTPLSTHMHTKGLCGNADGGNLVANPWE